jgi:hypothetical protein
MEAEGFRRWSYNPASHSLTIFSEGANMASETLSPYYTNTLTQAFGLVSATSNGAIYQVSGRPLSQPYSIAIDRKLTPPSAAANDRVIVRLLRTEPNSETNKLATFAATLTISIPKDQTVISLTVQEQLLNVLASLINECAAVSASMTQKEKILTGNNW